MVVCVWSSCSVAWKQIQTTCFLTNLRPELGKHLTVHLSPPPKHHRPLLPLRLLLRPNSDLSPHSFQPAFLCLLSRQISSLTREQEHTTAGARGQLRVKWMMGNGVLAKSARCNLLTSVSNCERGPEWGRNTILMLFTVQILLEIRNREKLKLFLEDVIFIPEF